MAGSAASSTMAAMSEQASEIDSGAADVLGQMAATPAPVPDLTLEAATPLRTLPPELVALIVGRVQAGVTAFGDDHPRAAITNRIVVPSTVLAVLDAVGLIAAVFTGHAVLALVAALLLLVLAYLALAGVRFVRADPLRVTPEQLAYVEALKTWSSHLEWTDEQRSGPWGRLRRRVFRRRPDRGQRGMDVGIDRRATCRDRTRTDPRRPGRRRLHFRRAGRPRPRRCDGKRGRRRTRPAGGGTAVLRRRARCSGRPGSAH